MPMTLLEGAALAPKAIGLIVQVEANIAKMPPQGQRKAVDYARAFGAAEDSPLMVLAQLVDEIEADIKS